MFRDVDSSGGSVKKSLVQLCAERGLGITLTIKLVCFKILILSRINDCH